MRMMENETLKDVYNSLLRRNLSDALKQMAIYLSTRPRHNDGHRLEAIRADFQLMTDYWKRGFRDPQLPALYENLLRRMYVLYANAALTFSVGHSSYLSSVYMRLTVTARDWSIQSLKESLESFVSEVAMLELEPEHVRAERQKEVYRRHHLLMSEWFDNICLSTIWTDGQALSMEEILLSPTIDSNDQQLLVSGMSLALFNHFDVAKFRVLLHVYQQSADEPVRQRALVGWVLALHDDIGQVLYPDVVGEVEKLLENQSVCEELVQLQQQIILCINAEKDNQTIQKEIMPDLLNNSHFRVTKNGIEEIEDSPLDDILHPDAEERRMEQMEESFQRMQSMQKQGSDIYFGGFSQMKRFSFFQEICNWFVPFYLNHPGIAETVSRFSKNRFLHGMMTVGPFCNSDKYSFMLAFGQVVNQIPQQLREMMERGEASVAEVLKEESQSAAFIRRTYLQDLYRFFRLYSYRSEFFNPFDHGQLHFLFFAFPMFSKTHLEPYFNEVAAFLMKKNMMYDAGCVLANCGEARRDFRHYMMAGYLVQHKHFQAEETGVTDLELYQRALELQPDNERALLGYARALFGKEQYEEALSAYEQLLEQQPDKKSYLLNRAVCLSRMNRYSDALKDLYRLNYESPDDASVNRVFAWVLTCDEKYEQAEKIYSQLLSGKPQDDDFLNYGYCLWLGGHVDEAADCFHRYMKETEETPQSILEKEWQLLRDNGVTEPERQMMLYLL